MPYFFDRTFVRSLDLSVLVNTLKDVTDLYRLEEALKEAGIEELEAVTCGYCLEYRLAMPIDGQVTCLVCKHVVEREYSVTLNITGRMTVTITAKDEEAAGDLAVEKFDNGDIDIGDGEDWEVEVDHVSVW